MQRPKHGEVSLAVWSAIYGTSESFLKRASAAGVNISNKAEVMAYLHQHGRESTKFAVAKGQAPEKIGVGPRESAPKGVTPAPVLKPKKPQPRAKTPEEARAILKARKEHFEKMPPEKQAEWSPEQRLKWLTEV